MSDLLSGLLGLMLATNQTLAASNFVHERTGLTVNVANPSDPVEQAFQKLLAADDEAHEEIDRWIKENDRQREKGGGFSEITINARVEQKLDEVRKSYESFLVRHPDHARARTAYASFLSDQGDEDAALVQLEKSRQIDPKNAATWNNLGNYYGHNGPVEKAFEAYARAIELNPTAAVYYQNLATTVYLFRHDATNYFKLNLDQVFDRSMALYRKAMQLDPTNFFMASDYAQSFYGFRPKKTGNPAADEERNRKHWQEGMEAWQHTYKIARDEMEREGVRLHYARMQINLGQFDEARRHLDTVTNQIFASTKERILKNIVAKNAALPHPATNQPSAKP